MHAAHDVAGRAGGVEAQRPGVVLQRQSLDVRVAALDREHVAAPVAAIEHDRVARHAADDDGIGGGAARVERELAVVNTRGQRDDVARLGG